MSRRLYVGNLPRDVRESEIEDLFEKYGRIDDIDLKGARGFAFLEFRDVRDAEDAVRGRDGYKFDGRRLRVEFSRNRKIDLSHRRTDHTILVSNLPKSASWQDLKDHFRDIGEVTYTEVRRDGTGIVCFTSRDDMRYAIRKLDDTEFRNPFDRNYIRVREYQGSRSR